MVAFHIFPFLIFAVAEIRPHTGNRKILIAAAYRRNAAILSWDEPAIFVQSGLHGKLVMLKSQIFFGGGVVGIFRADMLECCQARHLPFQELQI